jgi:predicted metal-dependent HD superfamily phosphohydrolase
LGSVDGYIGPAGSGAGGGTATPAATSAADGLREQLEAAYGDSSRGYHDLLHLTEVLEHVDVLMAPDEPAREAVLLAAWFHDAVYDGQGDDEERSAQLASTSLDGTPLASEVARLVRLTATHRPADDDPAGQVLCDADLGILAADDERYAAYTAGVRAEYAQVPDADFAAGRAAVLRDLLAKPTLFHTATARREWEEPARANVSNEIAQLEAAHRAESRSGSGEQLGEGRLER